ncbi:hypothetical protein AMK59_5806, partial [Oryctes borbonicus]
PSRWSSRNYLLKLLDSKMFLEIPTLRNLTSSNFGKAPSQQNPLLAELGRPHIDSFNYMVDTGLDDAVANLYPVEFELPTKDKVSLSIDDITLGYPAAPLGAVGIKHQNIYPTECKQRGVTYRGRLCIRVSWSINGKPQVAFDKDLGDVP